MKAVAWFGLLLGIVGTAVCMFQTHVPLVPFAVMVVLTVACFAWLYEHHEVDLIADRDDPLTEFRKQLRDLD